MVHRSRGADLRDAGQEERGRAGGARRARRAPRVPRRGTGGRTRRGRGASRLGRGVRLTRARRRQPSRDHRRRELDRAAAGRPRPAVGRRRLLRDPLHSRNDVLPGRDLPGGRAALGRSGSFARSRHAPALARLERARPSIVRALRARSRIAGRHAGARHPECAHADRQRGVRRGRSLRIAARARRRRERRSRRRPRRHRLQRFPLRGRLLLRRQRRERAGRSRGPRHP